MNFVNVNAVRVHPLFEYTRYSKTKYENKKKAILEGHKPQITITSDNLLVDGYISYVIYRELGIKEIPCTYNNDTRLTSFYGLDPDIRIQVFDRDNGVCYICGRKRFRRDATVDHVIPKVKGGTDDLDNLKCCCKICNTLKGQFTYSKELKAVIMRELKERGEI